MCVNTINIQIIYSIRLNEGDAIIKFANLRISNMNRGIENTTDNNRLMPDPNRLETVNMSINHFDTRLFGKR